jgi:hypothetical protein
MKRGRSAVWRIPYQVERYRDAVRIGHAWAEKHAFALQNAGMYLEEDGVPYPALLTGHVFHRVVAFEAQMDILVEIALPVHVTTAFVAPRCGDLNGRLFQLCQRIRPPDTRIRSRFRGSVK